jgi:aryl-alcohol dehydrogenase-like predicted oxidoreductase
MDERKLGTSGLSVSPLCLGGNVFGWTADEDTSFEILDAFVDAGFNFIDTADVYSKWVPGNRGGESEAILGAWFQRSGNRKRVVLATKVGSEMPGVGKGLSRKYIMSAVDDSLRRLQTDYIDLYQTHYDDPETPVEETLRVYADLVQQGKVRAIGASNMTPERLVESLKASKRLGIPRYESLQPLYNLYDRSGFETQFEPICREHRLCVLPYFSLAAGFLTGKYREDDDLSISSRGEMVKKYLNPRGFRILESLDRVAKESRSTSAKVAIAWLLTRPAVTAPIASATSLSQLNGLMEATRLKLRPEEVETLNRASEEYAQGRP